MSGPTGGVQGQSGTLFGFPYQAGGLIDKVIEAYSGTHDMIGGRLSGLYDSQGNAKRGMTIFERKLYDHLVTTTAIIPSTPFAMAELLSPDAWNALILILRGIK